MSGNYYPAHNTIQNLPTKRVLCPSHLPGGLSPSRYSLPFLLTEVVVELILDD